MRTSSLLLLPLCATSSVLAAGLFGSSGSQRPLGGGVSVLDNEVPGENPLEFCEDPKDNILEIQTVNLVPNPPEAGKTLSIQANGTTSEEVREGSYVDIVVKYGLIKILTLREDLCDQLKNVDKECPLKNGTVVLSKDVDLPSRIPPGTYSVLADVYNDDDSKITCIQASIKFG